MRTLDENEMRSPLPSGALLREHLIAKGLLIPAEQVREAPKPLVWLDMPTVRLEGAKKHKWDLEAQETPIDRRKRRLEEERR